MSKHAVDQIRNVAFCGHGSAGKTTLVDRILNHTGAINRTASVDDGTSVCDFDEEEKQHKYSIEASLVRCEHGGKLFNLIDTPGYPDFIGQAIGAMRGVDTVAIVINAQAGIEVNTRRVFNEAKKAGLGKMIVINKMDADNIDFPALMDNIRELFGPACVLLNVPLGHGSNFSGVAGTLKPPAEAPGALVDPKKISQPLLESIIEADEAVMERYFEGAPPTDEEIAQLIVKAVAQETLVPVVCASGKTGVGLPELIDALALCGLPPDAIARTARNSASEEVAVKADPAGPLVAQVFKTRIDPFVQKLNFIRVFSGTLKKDTTIPVVGVRKPVKIGPLLRVQAEETEPTDAAGPGEIVAVAKVEELHTGSSLGELAMPPISFPTPMVGLAVSPKSRGDETKLSGALQKICEEDSTFRRELDMQTKEMVVTGMSELHLQIIRERLKRRDKVEVETREPKIPYRETIQANAEGMYRHKKQTGGRGQFGEVHIRMFPLPKDVNVEEWATKARFASMKEPHYDEENNFLWIDSVVGGTIPGNFMPAVEKGFRDRLERGVIAGFKVQDICIEVHFGKHHPVDSSEQAFKTAASMAFRNVFQQAKPALLEPIVRIEVTAPMGNIGDINSDMSGRRGRVLSMDSAGGDLQTVIAEVPLAEVTTYSRSLSSITGGRGSYSIEFSHYDIVPGNVQQEIIAKAQMKDEEEE
ncbi:MAG: elongation factor G [Pirellulales bacterium]|nr:elongation factor G [Pirellulales bacterium]